jgi:hypothetical protein
LKPLLQVEEEGVDVGVGRHRVQVEHDPVVPEQVREDDVAVGETVPSLATPSVTLGASTAHFFL